MCHPPLIQNVVTRTVLRTTTAQTKRFFTQTGISSSSFVFSDTIRSLPFYHRPSESAPKEVTSPPPPINDVDVLRFLDRYDARPSPTDVTLSELLLSTTDDTVFVTDPLAQWIDFGKGPTPLMKMVGEQNLGVINNPQALSLEIVPYEMMNRNVRKPKKANHGKRPCSR